MQKMDILIECQKVVSIEVLVHGGEGDERYHVLDIENTHKLLGAWVELDPARRFYSWPAERDHEDMMLAWYTESSGLVHNWIGPFWDGRGEWDAHTLERIDECLPVGALEYDSLTTSGGSDG